MAFQNQAYLVPALGKQGTESRQDPVSQGSAYFAENDTDNNLVIAGGFVFAGTNDNQVKGTAVAGTVPVGVAVFPQYQIGITSNCNINQGEVIRVNYKGCVFSKPFVNDATKGQHVLIDATTGDLMASDNTSVSATDNTNAFNDTGWIVKTGNAVGQVVEIQRI